MLQCLLPLSCVVDLLGPLYLCDLSLTRSIILSLSIPPRCLSPADKALSALPPLQSLTLDLILNLTLVLLLY